MKEIKFKFKHGLGDIANGCLMFNVLKNEGYDVTVDVDPNKLLLLKAAGIKAVTSSKFPSHDYLHSAHFFDLSKPDCEHNKMAHGMFSRILPTIGTPEEVWDKLCKVKLSADPLITADIEAETLKFLEGLPRPIVCMHTIGSNWSEKKSLSIETSFNTLRKILDYTKGSVVSLDFDGREPIVSSARCKGIKPSWGHISFDRLCCLFKHADLLVAIDSGPMHCASVFTEIPIIGLFSGIHPVRVCVPNKNAFYMVPSKHHTHWQDRKHDWNFVEYVGDTPIAEEIALSVVELLREGKISDSMITTPADLCGMWMYERVEHDKRKLELLPGGKIGEGKGGNEKSWYMFNEKLHIAGENGVIARLSYMDDVFSGQWTKFEKMRIILSRLK
jgi:ADP-heptose:LPS heptosyltransferase